MSDLLEQLRKAVGEGHVLVGDAIHADYTHDETLTLSPVVPRALVLPVSTDEVSEVLRLATLDDHPGVFNVAGPGTILLSQAIRRAGRVELPVPGPAVRAVGNLVRRTGLVDFSPEQLRFLTFGRVVDIDRLRTQFPYTPKYSTAEAFSIGPSRSPSCVCR